MSLKSKDSDSVNSCDLMINFEQSDYKHSNYEKSSHMINSDNEIRLEGEQSNEEYSLIDNDNENNNHHHYFPQKISIFNLKNSLPKSQRNSISGKTSWKLQQNEQKKIKLEKIKKSNIIEKKFKKKNRSNIDLKNIEYFLYQNIYIVNYFLIKEIFFTHEILTLLSQNFQKMILIKLLFLNLFNILIFVLFLFLFRKIKSQNLKEVCFFFIIYSFCQSLGYISLLMFIEQYGKFKYFFLVFTPQLIILIILISMKNISKLFRLAIAILFFEWIQYILILMKLQLIEIKWNFVLIIYEIQGCFYFLLSILLSITFFCLMIFLLLKRKIIKKFYFLAFLLIILSINLFYIIWYGFFFYYSLEGIKVILMNDKAFDANTQKTLRDFFINLSSSIKPLEIFTFILFNISFILIKILSFFFENKQQRVVAIQDLNDILNIKFLQISEGILKENSIYYDQEEESCSEEHSPLFKVETRRTKCLTCRNSFNEVIINPCGHSGFCEDCMNLSLKNSHKCPLCGQKINKVYIIFYDPEKDAFISQSIINL